MFYFVISSLSRNPISTYTIEWFRLTRISPFRFASVEMTLLAGSRIEWFTANSNGEAETVRVIYRSRPNLRKQSDNYDFASLAIKGRSSRGNLLTRNPIARIQLKSLGVSTIGGKEIWFDEDIQRLNDAGRGTSLGEFQQDDKILVVLKNGNYYTTSFDLSNRYQGDIIRIEKLDPDAVFSAAYYDKESKFYYVKRFCFEVSDNKEQSFISEAPGSKLCDICCDTLPRLEVTYKGKNASRAHRCCIDLRNPLSRNKA